MPPKKRKAAAASGSGSKKVKKEDKKVAPKLPNVPIDEGFGDTTCKQ
jgi:hypothetical protein